MAAKANVIGIIVQPGGTVLVGRESTVADDGVAGINLRGFISASFVQTANDSSANYHANSSGSNISSSRESHSRTTGYNAGNYNLQVYNGAMDTAGVLKYIIAHTAADKKVMLADDDLSDISFDTGTTSILDSTISTPSAITIGKNGSAANTVVDVSSSNHTIRCGQGMNFYNGGTLLARASTLYLGTTSSSPFTGENSSRWGINLSGGKIGGTSTSAAPTGTWYVSSIKSTSSANTLRFTTGTCTITGKNTSANRFFEITDGNIYHSDGTLTIDSGVSAEMQWDAVNTDQDNGPYNFIINDASCTARIRSPLEILNDLTLTAGTFNTHSNDGGADKNLTVTGNVIITGGGLVCNSSTVIANSFTISGGGIFSAPDASGSCTINGTLSAWSFQNNSTGFSHNNGTITQTNAGHIKSVSSNPMYNFIMNSGSSDSHEAVFRPSSGTDCVIAANEVTITRGVLKLNTASHTASMASLTIANTGTYQASSTSTTISGGASVTANRCLKVSTNGVFTHNGGTLNVTGTDWGGSNYAHLWVPDGFDFGNVTINAGGADSKYYQFREGAGTMNFNDVYCKSGEWRDYNNNNTFNIRGNLDIGTRFAGGTNAALFGSDARDNANTTKLIVGGLVTNYTNGQFHVPYGTDGTDGCKIGGLRNRGGTVYGDTA